jgi:multicomponent Na+:H+ antiporter subunit E
MRRRYIAYATGLAVAWTMLWDRVSVANVVGGFVVAAALLLVFPLRPVAPEDRRLVRPVALLRLAASVVVDVVVATVVVARTVVSPSRRHRTGVVACRMRTASPKVLSTVANALALSPGTMAVDATNDPPTLYVHVLQLDSTLDMRRKVAHLERLVIEALGSEVDRRALAVASETVRLP